MSLEERVGTVDPAAAGATVGRIVVFDESPLGPLQRAVGNFNASEAARTVAGLSRTLGAPFVSIGAAAGSAGEVRITVAWDLCWYQWTVDCDRGSRPLLLAKGQEIDQLDRSARQWNATAVEGGRLSVRGPAG